MNTTRHFGMKKVATFAVALLLVVPVGASIAPRPANALFGSEVLAAAWISKETILDGIAWTIAKTAVASMQRSLVNWINSGFEGSPAFASDLKQNLRGVGDAVVATVVSEIAGELTDELLVDSPYQDEIATAIRTGYYLSTGGSFYVRNPFTLGQYSQDPRRFLSGEFSQGGLEAWYATVTNCQNNPYCAYQLAAREVDSRLAAAGGQRITELNWGDGFLSFRGKCKAFNSAREAVVALQQNDDCVGKPIRTPGSVISGQLNATLPSGMQGLITADEIDEVIGALFQQLINKVIGQDGLIGVSQPQSGGGPSYLDQTTISPGRGAPTLTLDADAAAQLQIFEVSWASIRMVAERAAAKCPNSNVASRGIQDAITAEAKVDTVRKLLAQPGASLDAVQSVLPTDAEVALAQAEASEADSSLKSQLEVIQSSRSCPSN